jgi:hypothetical protein
VSEALLTSFVIALLVPATAAAVASFRTPERMAYCGLTEGEPPAALVCWRPRDGLTLTMDPRSRAKRWVNGLNRNFHQPARFLRFGQTWRAHGFRCTSRRSGLRCVNRAGHGWLLGRQTGVRTF